MRTIVVLLICSQERRQQKIIGSVANMEVGNKVLFNVNWTTRKEKETIGEIREIRNGFYIVFAYGNYFYLKQDEFSLIREVAK